MSYLGIQLFAQSFEIVGDKLMGDSMDVTRILSSSKRELKVCLMSAIPLAICFWPAKSYASISAISGKGE